MTTREKGAGIGALGGAAAGGLIGSAVGHPGVGAAIGGGFRQFLFWPAVIEHVWDASFLVSEASFLGEALKAVFGYNANPSLTEVFAYLGYFAVIAGSLRYLSIRQSLPQNAAAD